MNSDSDTTRRQKSRLAERTEVAYGIKLPDWFLVGTTVSGFRALYALLESAHERYSEESVPVTGRCEMAPESPMPEGNVIEWMAGGRRFRLVEGREYKIVTMIPGVERKPRYSRMHFMGQRYRGRIGPGTTLEFSGRGPDRTHSGKYCGTAGVPVRSILEVEEVERDVAARYAFQRQPEPEAARRDGR